ncbi:MAG: MSHA biogenesis protein MshO [Planctomycetota bacterium]|jgi:MSHA biogenesis protein MshO
MIELIVVIVLLGIVGSVAGVLITKPIEAYRDQARRQQLVDQGEMSLRQIARDVRRALPNSLRVTPVAGGWALEMVNTVDGARYRDEATTLDYTSDIHWLDFTQPDDQFNFLGRLNNLASADFAAGGLRLVIYNTSATSPGSNIYAEAADISDYQGIITRGDMSFTLGTLSPGTSSEEDYLIFSDAFMFTRKSPGQRLFVVDGPVSYICDLATSRITRYSGYSFAASQPTVAADFSGGSSGVVVSQINSCAINYDVGSAQRGGIVTTSITLTSAASENITLLHQIHVANLP